MRPHRLAGWQSHLARYLAHAADRPFAWGSWDCALFVAGAVLILTGRDVRPDWSYDSRDAGVRLMRAAGHRDHVAYFRSLFPAIGPQAAQPGDIAIMPGRALGIVQGRAVYQVTPAGLGIAPVALMRGVLAV